VRLKQQQQQQKTNQTTPPPKKKKIPTDYQIKTSIEYQG
jgi:hypothetical protein